MILIIIMIIIITINPGLAALRGLPARRRVAAVYV